MTRVESPSPKRGSGRVPRASIGAFALSVAVHAAVLLTVGGLVVFEGVVPRTPFLAAVPAGPGDLEEAVMPEPTELSEMPETPALVQEFAVEAGAEGVGEEATSADLLVSSGVNPTFTLPPAVGPTVGTPQLGVGLGGRGEGGAGAAAPSTAAVIRSVFGENRASPAGLRGALYDLKQPKSGPPTTNWEFVRAFAASGFKRSMLRNFYKAQTELHATQIFMPVIRAEEAPRAFQAEREIKPHEWLIVYEGRFAAPESGSWRFAGAGDNVLIVVVNGRIVFDGSRETSGSNGRIEPYTDLWTPTEDRILRGAQALPAGNMVLGDWMPLAAGETHEIMILVGESEGGSFSSYLFVEKQGKRYERDPRRGGAPILPLFRTVRSRDDWSAYNPADVPAYDERGPVFAPQ